MSEKIVESIQSGGRPAAVDFMIYELLSGNNCDDEYINEVADALADIVS